MCLHYTTEACVAHRRVYTTKACAAPWFVYAAEACPSSGGVYNTEVLAVSGLVYGTEASAAHGRVYATRGRSCTWTCLHYKGLCSSWRCLHYRGLSCPSGRVYTSVTCAGPGQHQGDRQQHSPGHLLFFKILAHAECALKKVYARWVCAKKGLCMLSVR